MPGGPTLVGVASFAGIKLVGYGVAGYQLNRLCHTTKPHPVVFGLIRTTLGVAAGIAFASVALEWQVTRAEAVFYVGLAPVRMLEWLLMLWFFYVRSGLSRGRWVKYSVLGSLWSYLLDVPAVLSVIVIPGGVWIC